MSLQSLVFSSVVEVFSMPFSPLIWSSSTSSSSSSSVVVDAETLDNDFFLVLPPFDVTVDALDAFLFFLFFFVPFIFLVFALSFDMGTLHDDDSSRMGCCGLGDETTASSLTGGRPFADALSEDEVVVDDRDLATDSSSTFDIERAVRPWKDEVSQTLLLVLFDSDLLPLFPCCFLACFLFSFFFCFLDFLAFVLACVFSSLAAHNSSWYER
mmetsp:Transcript_12378/g.15444  ORF Transcript_12378/g.15444 Transcript_12378/m.15444 type:complete len:212 (+) Transcript_12378:353-988(+)